MFVALDGPSLEQGLWLDLPATTGTPPKFPPPSKNAVESACARQQPKLEASCDSQKSPGDRQPLR